MNRFINLFLAYAPWVAVIAGGALLAWSLLHLAGLFPLPGVPRGRKLPSIASGLLGSSLTGLGLTYLLTDGRPGYSNRYMLWLYVAALSGVVGLLDDRK